MASYDSLSKDQQQFFIEKYGRHELYTVEQEHIIANIILTTPCTKAQVTSKMMELASQYLTVSYAGMQFPCKCRLENEALNYGRVRVFRELADSILREMRDIVQNVGRQFDDYEFETTMRDMIDTVRTDGYEQMRNKWNAIKWDMYPPHLLSKRITDDHEAAIRDNESFDQKRIAQQKQEQRDAILAQLTPEQRALLLEK